MPGIQRLIGDVRLGWKEAILTCDSAYRYDDGPFEVMGAVNMEDGRGGNLTANRMRLEPEPSWVLAYGDDEPVTWTDLESKLIGQSFVYEMDTRDLAWSETAAMHRRSVSTQDTLFMTSQRGHLWMDEDRLTLWDSVWIQRPSATLISDSLVVRNLNDATKIELLGATSMWSSESTRFFHGDRGELDLDGESGWLAAADSASAAWFQEGDVVTSGLKLTLVDSLEQVIEGNVYVSDTLGSFALWGRKLELEGDTLLLTGSGIQPAQVSEATETPWLITADTILRVASAVGDALLAWPDAHMMQDESAGACDTLLWQEADSMLTFLGQPVLWTEGSRLSSDSLWAHLVDGGMDRLDSRGHVCMTSGLDGGADSLHHTISGRSLEGFFDASGDLDFIWVSGNSEVIQFDEDGQSLNHVQSSRLRIDFDGGTVEDIVMLGSPNGVWTSVQGAPNLALPQCPHEAAWPPRPYPDIPQLQIRFPRSQIRRSLHP